MKAIKNISILFFTLLAFYACNDEQLNVDNWDGNTSEGGLLDVKNTSINYVVGNPGPYSANIRVFQGAVKTTSIRVAKTFYTSEIVTDPITGDESKVTVKSNTVDTFKTIEVSNTDQNSFVNYSFTFPEMVAGLSIDGTPLSTSDGDYLIGDYWLFEYYVTNSNGENLNYTSTKATISTRFAGTYTVLESAYWNSGAPQGGWNGDTFVIESIDASIYKHNGLAFWGDQTYYFTVDSATGAIQILPTDLEGNATLLNGSPIMICPGGDYTFESLSCINKATKNDVTGEDILEFTTGYFRGVGATREFYEKMIKQVD
jgi:hypothetical protein